MALKLANNAVSTLASTLSAASTTLGVLPGDGAKFPSIGSGDWFPLTIVNPLGDIEIVKCTARTGDTFTIERAQEGTSAAEFAPGDRVELRLTAAAVEDLKNNTLLKYAQVDIPTADQGPIYVVGKGAYEWNIATAQYEPIIVADNTVVTASIKNENVTLEKLKDNVFGGLAAEAAVQEDYVVIVDASDANRTKKSPVNVFGFPSGTKMPFYQTTAPTGWTKLTDAALNDAVLRIVTGAAGVTGGSTAFSTFNAQTAVGSTTLSAAQMPSHAHSVGAVTNGGSGAGGASIQGSQFGTTGYFGTTGAGSGGSHTHSITTNIKYADFIVASKD